MKRIDDEMMWALVATGSAVAAGFLVRTAVKQGWRTVRGEDPPDNPEEHDVPWRDAVLWSGATALAAGLGRLLARRGAAAGWKAFTGRPPPL